MNELYNVEAEKALIGSLLIDSNMVGRVTPIVSPSDFYIKKFGWMYEAILALYRRRAAIDVVTVPDELQRRGRLEKVGGVAEITELVNYVPSALNVMSYAKIVQDLSRRRSLKHVASRLAKAAYDTDTAVDDTLDRAALGIRQLVSPQQMDQLLETPDVPGLTFKPDFSEIGSAGAWLDEYVTHAQCAAPMTPEIFHESAGLWLLSIAVARRLVLPLAFGDIFPSLWIAWVAPTTLWTKTTALTVARRIAQMTVPFLLSPEEITPESMVADMSGAEPTNVYQMTMEDQQTWQLRRNHAGQRGWSLDEFSGLLASAGRDYNAGLLETLLLLYDCAETYTRMTQSHGMQTIHNAYLSVLAASTPTALASHLTAERLWGMGWWPRFAILTPESNRPAWRLPERSDRRDAIANKIRTLYERLPETTWPEPPEPKIVTFDEHTYDLWSQYNRALRYDLLDQSLDHRLWGAYGRLPVAAWKVSTLLAAADWDEGNSPRIARAHMLRAIQITEQWRASAHRALIMASVEAEEKLQQRIVYQIARRDTDGATFRDLYKSMRGVKHSDIRDALQELIDIGEIILVERVVGPKGGRPTDRYYLTARSPHSALGESQVLGT